MPNEQTQSLTVLTHLVPGYPEQLFTELATGIEESLHVPVRLEIDPRNSGPCGGDTEPFSPGVDVAFLCATSYVWLRARNPPPMRLAGCAWVPLDQRSRGHPRYFTDIVVRADDERQSFGDLRDTTIACNDEASLSGCHSLRIELLRRGLGPDYWDPRFTGSHHRSIAAVLSGEMDAAALDSVVLWRARRDDARAAALRTVATCGPFPTQPVVVVADMPDHQRRAVRDVLLGAHRLAPAAFDEAGLARFAPVHDSDYDTLASALADVDASR